MPYRTPDASMYTSMKRLVDVRSSTTAESKLKYRSVPTYSFYQPTYKINVGVNSLISNKFALPPQVSGLPAGFGGTLQFVGGATPSYVSVANKAGLQLGTGDFTIEWFMNMSSSNPSFPRVFEFSKGTVGSGTEVYGVSIEGGTFYFWNNNGAVSIGDYSSIPNAYDSWHHIAIVGTGGTTIKVFVDGTQFGTTQTVTYDFTDVTATLSLGTYPQDSAQSAVSFVGFLSNFRILKGVALYTGSFTKPTTPLADNAASVVWFKSESAATAYDDSSADKANSVISLVGPNPPVWSSQLVS